MDVYAELDYKKTIQLRLKELNQTRKRLTLKKISEKIRIQYTYLSKALNDEKTHLNEDHLFALCGLLDLFPEEIDYILLLRAHCVAADPRRKAYLHAKLNQARKARHLNASIQEAQSRQLAQDMAYLFDPLCLLTHVLLHIDEYFKNPRRICGAVGITPAKLNEILRKLNELEFIELSPETGAVVRVMRGHIHYSTGHPLMRVHQSLLRTLSASQIQRVSEDDKHNMMVTFTGDAATFERIKVAFQKFLQEIEKTVVNAPSEHAYQLCFDLFKWI